MSILLAFNWSLSSFTYGSTNWHNLEWFSLFPLKYLWHLGLHVHCLDVGIIVNKVNSLPLMFQWTSINHCNNSTWPQRTIRRRIPRGSVETGQDHRGLEPRNRAKKRRTARRIHTDTVDKTEKDRRETIVGHRYNASRLNNDTRQQNRITVLVRTCAWCAGSTTGLSREQSFEL